MHWPHLHFSRGTRSPETLTHLPQVMPKGSTRELQSGLCSLVLVPWSVQRESRVSGLVTGKDGDEALQEHQVTTWAAESMQQPEVHPCKGLWGWLLGLGASRSGPGGKLL